MKLKLKIWHISDTHGLHHQIDMSKIPPDVDVVIHSGDESDNPKEYLNHVEYNSFINWFSELNIPHKILIAGNHSSYLYKHAHLEKIRLKELGITYLEDSEVVINGIKFYGSPYSKIFGDWFFMAKANKLIKHWEAIPEDTDILITHTPPHNILDKCNSNNIIDNVGCRYLKKRVIEVNPRYHLFGHIHDNRGIDNYAIKEWKGVTYINSSLFSDHEYKIIHSGNVFEIEKEISDY